MAKKKDTNLTKTKEITESNTATRSGESVPVSIEELLGKAESPPIDHDRYMLKLRTPKRLEKIVEELHLESRLESTENSRTQLVLGPFSRSQMMALCHAKLLGKRDEILLPQNTWKSIPEMIGDIKHDNLVSDEITLTGSQTESITQTTQTAAATKEETPKPAVVEQRVPRVAETVVGPSVANLPNASRPSRPMMRVSASSASSQNTWAWVGILGVVLGLGAVWKFGSLPKLGGAPTSEDSTAGTVTEAADWPEYLRVRDLEDLRAEKSPLVAKISPILDAYEKGAKVVSETDLRLLKILSGPGSSSLEARTLATNLLASLAISRSQTDDARKLLDKMLEVVPTDSTTLLNQSLVYLVGRDYRISKDLASTALRLCRGQSCWVSRAILGLIAAEEGRWPESDENFRSALTTSRGSLWVMGLWLRSLKNAPKDIAKSKSASLLVETLVLDPDLIVDSPLHAPLATQIFLTEVLRGFRNALALAPDALSDGQKKYIEWILSRMELNPLSSSTQEVLDKLRSESQALSQLAASYIEKELGHLDKSADLLTATLKRLSGSQIKSSWPWSFAGDIQRNRGLFDQAVIFYEAALSRNPQDVNAVFGLSLILREKKDYKSAFQKLQEVQALDPNYMPALLRRDRFEWERMWFSR